MSNSPSLKRRERVEKMPPIASIPRKTSETPMTVREKVRDRDGQQRGSAK